MLHRLPIGLAQAGNTSVKTNSLYQAKEIIKKVYRNATNSIKV